MSLHELRTTEPIHSSEKVARSCYISWFDLSNLLLRIQFCLMFTSFILKLKMRNIRILKIPFLSTLIEQ